MYRWQMNRWYREPERWTPWTAGLVSGALGMMVVGALWYVGRASPPLRRRAWGRVVAYPAPYLIAIRLDRDKAPD